MNHKGTKALRLSVLTVALGTGFAAHVHAQTAVAATPKELPAITVEGALPPYKTDRVQSKKGNDSLPVPRKARNKEVSN